MPRCSACQTDGAKLRCSKCNEIFYCSKACQMRNWKRIHEDIRRVGSTDPLLVPYFRVELAVERILAKQPKVRAPKDATCYICLEGEDGGKLMRGCACRGDSAGYVHLECLAEHAVTKEASCLTKIAMNKDALCLAEIASSNLHAILFAWSSCVNCRQNFTDALHLEMTRRFWRHHRSSPSLHFRYHSMRPVKMRLWENGEFDAAKQLNDEMSKCARNNKELLHDMKTHEAALLRKSGNTLEALELLQAILPEAKEMAHPGNYWDIMEHQAHLLLDLDRYQEAHEIAAGLMEFRKATLGPEHCRTVSARDMHAYLCGKLGRVDESKTLFNDLLTTEIRVYGRDNPLTKHTIRQMEKLKIPVPRPTARRRKKKTTDASPA